MAPRWMWYSGTPGAIGNDFAFLESVFGGIAVNEKCGGAFALGGERFESAIAVRIGIADEDDFAFDVDALLAQQVVVFGIAAVRVDQRGGHFAGGGHAAPGGADVFVFGVGVAEDGQFAQEGAVVNRRDHFQKGGFGIAAVNVVAADDDILEPFVSPLVGDVAGEFVVARRSGDVRFGGEDVVLAAFFVRRGNGFEFIFDFSFVSCGSRSEAEDGGLRRSWARARKKGAGRGREVRRQLQIEARRRS